MDRTLHKVCNSLTLSLLRYILYLGATDGYGLPYSTSETGISKPAPDVGTGSQELNPTMRQKLALCIFLGEVIGQTVIKRVESVFSGA